MSTRPVNPMGWDPISKLQIKYNNHNNKLSQEGQGNGERIRGLSSLIPCPWYIQAPLNRSEGQRQCASPLRLEDTGLEKWLVPFLWVKKVLYPKCVQCELGDLTSNLQHAHKAWCGSYVSNPCTPTERQRPEDPLKLADQPTQHAQLQTKRACLK